MLASRRWLLVVYVLAGCGIALPGSARAQAVPTAPADVAATPTTTVPRQGYSIFRGTMVELTWPEVKAAASSGALVLLPAAVIEEHGPHMGLGADTYMAYFACRQLQEALATRRVPAVIAPPVYWGVMQLHETGAYPGSFTVRPETMHALLYDVLTDLQRWGFRRVFLVELHGDRVFEQVQLAVMKAARDSLGLAFFNPTTVRGGSGPVRFRVSNPYQPDYHAGAIETAWIHRFFPEEVSVERARSLPPENSFHPLGYVGDPGSYANVDPDATQSFVTQLADAVAAWMKSDSTVKAAP